MSNYYKDITQLLQFKWAQQAAKELQLLHASDILHCDVGPHNFLLDASLDSKIADFSGSSLNGSCPSVCHGATNDNYVHQVLYQLLTFKTENTATDDSITQRSLRSNPGQSP